MINFNLEDEFIPLISLLKAVDLVQSGGEAKAVVDEGLVKVNDAVESRKRYKVRKGDKIEYNNQVIVVD